MLMKEQLAQLVIEGKKRQTRRPMKDGEKLITIDGVKTVLSAKGKIKYQVGREYSIQYGRGLPTRVWSPQNNSLVALAIYQAAKALGKGNTWPQLKIKLLDVWEEDVRTIFWTDAEDEGFTHPDEFLVTWCNFYDSKLNARWLNHEDKGFVLWNDTKSNGSFVSRDIEGVRNPVANFEEWLVNNRPAELYHASGLKFEVVKP